MAWLFLLIIFFNPIPTGDKKNGELIIWNVGQGQMVTWSEDKTCLHFDVGGEYFPAQKISEYCRNKDNILFLSHWDWDHIGFIKKLQQVVSSLCLEVAPIGHGSFKKEKMLSTIPRCSLQNHNVRSLNFNPPHQTKATNDLSHVFLLKEKILVPGDSPSKMEKIWVPLIKNPIEALILSHHGSRTATSDLFLNKIFISRIAIASSRKRKYGHPHQETLYRLKKHKIPTLTTEDWGSLHLLY